MILNMSTSFFYRSTKMYRTININNNYFIYKDYG